MNNNKGEGRGDLKERGLTNFLPLKKREAYLRAGNLIEDLQYVALTTGQKCSYLGSEW